MTQADSNAADGGLLNLGWAVALLDGLRAGGIEHAVISPGSRSTPLTIALQARPGWRTTVVLDERSAAFFALGAARACGRPVAVIATSGSAVANWYPAVIEAAYDDVPLVFVSADRPFELQHCDANQTIDQIKLFGDHVRGHFALPAADADGDRLAAVHQQALLAVDRSRWPRPGPVHLNAAFREPLVPAAPAHLPPQPPAHLSHGRLQPDTADLSELSKLLAGRPGLLIAGRQRGGHMLARAITALAERLGCPVLADPLSGLRFGDHDRSRVLTRYDAFLRRQTFTARHAPHWVLCLGRTPTSKALQAYLAAATPSAWVLVDPYGHWSDPLHRATHVLHADPEAVCAGLCSSPLRTASAEWLDAFRHEEARAAGLQDFHLPMEGAIMRALQHKLPAGSTLFLGSSMPVREGDAFLHGGSQAVRVIGNRGASGIDGNVSTVLGTAAAGPEPVVGVLGDLAFVHDLNGLLAARESRATLVILNNGGGGIFGYLPQAALADFERFWLTPVGMDFGLAAQLYGVSHQRVNRASAFEAALQEGLQKDGVSLIEVAVDRDTSLARHQAYWAAVAEA